MVSSNIYRTLMNRPLKSFYSIRIDNDGETKRVFFLSKIHVNKDVEVSFCFDSIFTDEAILKDNQLYGWLSNRFGSDII